MANNRVWLVNKETGKKMLIGKYYPSTGWYFPKPINLNIVEVVDTDELGMCGGNPFELEYEFEGEDAN